VPADAETFWSDFLRSLTRRGLRGVKLVISDAHEGLKTAAAAIRTAFVQEDHEAAVAQWRQVADSLRPRFEKLAELMDSAG
jgi:putative transposase